MSLLSGFVGAAALVYAGYALTFGDRVNAVDGFVVAALALAVCGVTWRRRRCSARRWIK